MIKNKTEEVNISTDLLNSINENPGAYTAHMEDWNEDKSRYIEELAELFSAHIVEREKDFNTFSYVVLAMNRWYMSLPKYAKELKSIYKFKSGDIKLNKSQIRFINSLKKSDINAREFLFKDLFEMYGYNDFNINNIANIEKAKKIFDTAKDEMIKQLIFDVKDIFKSTNNNATLAGVIKDFIETLKPETLDHLYPNGEHKILNTMKACGNDEKAFIERLAREVTTLRIDDWTSEVITSFVDGLDQGIKVIVDFDRIASISTKNSIECINGYKITFVDGNDNEVG